jgi:TRAP-type C4-dicarboxylate transport system permease small subunit
MARIVGVIRAVDGAAALGERWLAVALLAATVLIVVLQVVFRHVLNSSLSWAEEAARYLFVWAALLGFSSAVAAGQLFSFDMIYQRLGRAGRRVCGVLFVLAAVAFLAVLAVNGAGLVARTVTQTSPAMSVPMAWPYAALPVAAVLVALHFVRSLVDPRVDGHP